MLIFLFVKLVYWFSSSWNWFCCVLIFVRGACWVLIVLREACSMLIFLLDKTGFIHETYCVMTYFVRKGLVECLIFLFVKVDTSWFFSFVKLLHWFCLMELASDWYLFVELLACWFFCLVKLVCILIFLFVKNCPLIFLSWNLFCSWSFLACLFLFVELVASWLLFMKLVAWVVFSLHETCTLVFRIV